VALHDTSHDREADPGAFEVRRGVQALERLEEFVGVLGVEPDAIVTDRVEHLAGTALAGDLDPGLRGPAGELGGVPEQIRQTCRRSSWSPIAWSRG